MNNETNNLNGTNVGDMNNNANVTPNMDPNALNQMNGIPNNMDSLNNMGNEGNVVNSGLDMNQNVNPMPTSNMDASINNTMNNNGVGQGGESFNAVNNNFSNIPNNNDNVNNMGMDNNYSNFNIPNNNIANNQNDFMNNMNSSTMDPNDLSVPARKPKKNNKTLFVIIIIFALALVGFGIYYVLQYTNILNKKPTINIEVHNLELNLNDELPEDSAFATVTGASNCEIDKSNIDTSKVGTYEFTVKCGNVSKKGEVTVGEGEVAITLKVADVYKAVGETIDISEFIIDTSYTYEFANKDDVTKYLTNAGEYEVLIKAVDASNKEVTTTGKLYVTQYPVKGYLKCTTNEQNVADTSAVMTVQYQFGISLNSTSNSNVYSNLGFEIYTFTLSDETEYQEYVDSYQKGEDVTINNITSKDLEFDDDKKVIVMKKMMDNEAVKKQFGEGKYSDIKAYYMDTLKYTCVYELVGSND